MNDTQQNKIAAATAHRACCGSEHNPQEGKLHGYCVVCGVPFPCETARYFMCGNTDAECKKNGWSSPMPNLTPEEEKEIVEEMANRAKHEIDKFVPSKHEIARIMLSAIRRKYWMKRKG